jgi:hypothetical protein
MRLNGNSRLISLWFLPVLILLFATPCWPDTFAQSPMPEIKPGENSVAIRGRRQKIYFYPGAGAAPHHKILFAPGDGGHRGFAIKIAETFRIDPREQPQLRKQSRRILRRLATGNAMDQTTRGSSRRSDRPVALECRGR